MKTAIWLLLAGAAQASISIQSQQYDATIGYYDSTQNYSCTVKGSESGSASAGNFVGLSCAPLHMEFSWDVERVIMSYHGRAWIAFTVDEEAMAYPMRSSNGEGTLWDRTTGGYVCAWAGWETPPAMLVPGHEYYAVIWQHSMIWGQDGPYTGEHTVRTGFDIRPIPGPAALPLATLALGFIAAVRRRLG